MTMKIDRRRGYRPDIAQRRAEAAKAREDAVMRVEWEMWQEVCGALRSAKAVTEADMNSSTSTPETTPGLRLLGAIRRWGEAKEALARARRSTS